MVTIPIDPTLPDQTVEVQLDGTAYRFRAVWSERSGCYWLRLCDTTGDPGAVGTGDDLIATTRVLAQSMPGLWRTDPRYPLGQKQIVDTGGTDLDPAFGELGARVLLVYSTADEVAALAATLGA